MSVVRSFVTNPRLIARPGLHPFGGNHDVDVAGIRHQRHDRLTAVGGIASRKEFQVINCRAGALRDAGYRCCLHEVAGAPGRHDEPIGDDAAALAAQSRNRQCDGPRAPQASTRMTAERSRAMNRSHGVGFTMTSAR